MSLRDLAGEKPKRGRFTRTLTRRDVRRIKKRGYDAERELVQKLREAGFDAVRVPVSAPSSEPLPDVFAIKGDAILAFEVKSQERYAYYKRAQVEKLHSFLQIHRYYPRRVAVLAAKFKYKGWAFMVAEKPGDYSLKLGEGLTFRDLTRRFE
ncbi:MAG: Holliday junction resolvase Hjc [Candidatus Bathyarchaeia archaeon]